MSRYAKANQTIEDLKTLILKVGGVAWYDEKREGSPHEAVSNCEAVKQDLSKIEVDTENCDYIGEYEMSGTETLSPFEMIGSGESAFPVAWCACGGDWEQPLAFVLYIGQKGELRAYIPSDGNAYNHKVKSAYGNNDGDPNWEDNPDDPRLRFDADKLRAAVANRILVKGEAGSGNGGESPLTFRKLIQSLRDFGDQYASVMPVAKDAEASCWGIQYIWFEDGVLQLGQHDDEGLTCDLIAERAEGCIPSELLDSPARVKVGVTEKPNGVMALYTADGEPCSEHLVKSSVVKPCRGNDWFCKWTLKFV